MLKLDRVGGGYGRNLVVSDVDLEIAVGETVALLGPNGAGKSTLLAALSGLLRMRTGSAVMDGLELMRAPSHRIVAHGLAQVPEGRRVFAPFSVEDNLRLGTVQRRDAAWERFDYVFGLFPRLAERRKQLAGTLSGGEQQMLAIGRALMSNPRVLLLDEPFLGLAPRVVEEIRAALDGLRTRGLTMLLVEQKLDIALAFASRAYVMIKGRIALTDSTKNLAGRADLARLYFELASDQGGAERRE